MKKNTQEDFNTGNSSSGFIHGALLGTAIGLALGVLLFPEEGKKVKKKVKKLKTKVLEKNDNSVNVENIEHLITNKITHLADFSLDHINKRMKKTSKNASKRNFFRGSF